MKAVFFDLDGTLADTEDLKALALSAAVNFFGGAAGPDLYEQVMGKSWESVTDHFFQVSGVKVDLKDFNQEFRGHYKNLIVKNLMPDEETLDFVQYLKSKGLLLAVVSSAAPWMVELILSRLGLNQTFDLVVTGADVRHHKPDPEAYFQALERLTLLPSQVVAFEDSEAGIAAATEAGLKVFGRRHMFNQNHNFKLSAAEFRSFQECKRWTLFHGLRTLNSQHSL